VQWSATGNAADQRTWRAVLLPSGVLQVQALSDAGVLLAGIDFNRNGTLRAVAPATADNSQLVPTTAWVRSVVGARTVSALAPSGGNDGDIWYQV
jgi:hypothetical protein